MKNKTEAVQELEKFAQESLSNHLAELNTRYENEKPGKAVLQQAYNEHREIFEKELSESIESLLSTENTSVVKDDLENIKDAYLSKLQLDN